MENLRNSDLATLAQVLKDQHATKLDVIVPANRLSISHETGEAIVMVDGAAVDLTDEGVTSRTAALWPTQVFDEGLSQKLNIPLAYLHRMRHNRADLYAANVNGWLHGLADEGPDPRSFMVRAFARPEGGGLDGVARALLSDTYKVMDNLDVLHAALDGVRKSGAEVEVTRCDLTDRKMYVKISAPGVQALAPELLAGYRSPFTGAEGSDNPTVFAGFILSNSEVGGGAFTITPSMTVQVCKNGLTISKDAMRAVHLGSRLDEGVIRWSEETHAKTLELVTLKAADAVASFLDVDYMTAQLRKMSEAAGKPITGSLPDQITTVTKRLLISEDVGQGILDHFLRGGQFTAGGVMHAVTSFAQTLDDADEAYRLEEMGPKALELAAAL